MGFLGNIIAAAHRTVGGPLSFAPPPGPAEFVPADLNPSLESGNTGWEQIMPAFGSEPDRSLQDAVVPMPVDGASTRKPAGWAQDVPNSHEARLVFERKPVGWAQDVPNSTVAGWVEPGIAPQNPSLSPDPADDGFRSASAPLYPSYGVVEVSAGRRPTAPSISAPLPVESGSTAPLQAEASSTAAVEPTAGLPAADQSVQEYISLPQSPGSGPVSTAIQGSVAPPATAPTATLPPFEGEAAWAQDVPNSTVVGWVEPSVAPRNPSLSPDLADDGFRSASAPLYPSSGVAEVSAGRQPTAPSVPAPPVESGSTAPLQAEASSTAAAEPTTGLPAAARSVQEHVSLPQPPDFGPVSAATQGSVAPPATVPTATLPPFEREPTPPSGIPKLLPTPVPPPTVEHPAADLQPGATDLTTEPRHSPEHYVEPVVDLIPTAAGMKTVPPATGHPTMTPTGRRRPAAPGAGPESGPPPTAAAPIQSIQAAPEPAFKRKPAILRETLASAGRVVPPGTAKTTAPSGRQAPAESSPAPEHTPAQHATRITPIVTAARPHSAEPPPAVHIGTIEIIVEAPPPAQRPREPGPAPDLSSRFYLRRL
ncbi:MAG: hypothetical protein U1F76_31305 [Candidatus Competibacteraceae bacterium]